MTKFEEFLQEQKRDQEALLAQQHRERWILVELERQLNERQCALRSRHRAERAALTIAHERAHARWIGEQYIASGCHVPRMAERIGVEAHGLYNKLKRLRINSRVRPYNRGNAAWRELGA